MLDLYEELQKLIARLAERQLDYALCEGLWVADKKAP